MAIYFKDYDFANLWSQDASIRIPAEQRNSTLAK